MVRPGSSRSRAWLPRLRGERGNPALRLADRYAGIPLVAAAGAVRRRRSPPSDLRRIGVVTGGAIGGPGVLTAGFPGHPACAPPVRASSPRPRPRGRAAGARLRDDPYVVFHLGPTGVESHLKEGPAERWRELARQLGERGYGVVLTGAPSDRARTAEFLAGRDLPAV